MSEDSMGLPHPITLTADCVNKIKALIAEEGDPNLKLRVFVQGGGCSGFQYGFTFDDLANDDDTALSYDGVTLLVDAMSYQYLAGAKINYKDEVPL